MSTTPEDVKALEELLAAYADLSRREKEAEERRSSASVKDAINDAFLDARDQWEELHADGCFRRLLDEREELLFALLGCLEHMEHSTTQGRVAYNNAKAAHRHATEPT